MLEARGIAFAYPGKAPIYQGLDFSIEPGERVALQAPSGFGKTTLCRMLAGYLQPTAGQVLLDGNPLPRRSVCPVQLVWQHPEKAVDPRMRMAAMLAEAGVGHKHLRSLSDDALSQTHRELLGRLGIRDTWLTRFPHELSGGELQRFCIARALATRPRYLIADEISTMLDALTQAQIWHVLLEESAAQNMGVILVSHSPSLTARVATRTVRLG